MAVKNRLKEIIDGKGLKQTWLAEQVGVTRGTISNICNNRYKTTIELGFEIAKVLGVEFTDIFYYED
ncbi:TPA: helix-turn-helix domain-containing protein [Clostridium botulinum]|uniref:helix-turn-helix transcriptional regulator n=1 Tax=Clostridium botulinum TaxID=1491 RepID=UPI000774D4EC|nr:helix-turn-helix domain-containing protein [Clostridium botulinum]APH20860.1 helix-turn-helix family protein [Clostridium botulinum]APQ71382.1 helix-turn-helix family protein [Clostridium botulinum]EKS4345270.1 helix-turn-helix domain-containing protein [Clostridium botulinum]EKS4395947.1 helix-turn-helix domain-containing protein [Clostridium botulinum]MBD5589199.1 helix-turn-helix domain-containing protein [Clostridium botulinum]